MDLNNIKRNQLDYILTDILPNELSELFSFKYFYDFLLNKRKDVKEMIDKVIKAKNKSASEQVLFLGSINWATMPLKYTIMKGLHSSREISLLQPMAAVQIFLFITAYQKELLNILEHNSVYSLRYHQRNNELYYKNKNKSVIKYFEEESKKVGKDIIEQTGMFFDIKPYKSIALFTSSEEWFVLNSKDIITDPKTVKSNRMITMPEFLSEELESYLSMLYGLDENDRIFQISKSYLHHEMDRGVKLSGVKRIRIHDLRHSHVSLLINMGYSAVAIGERVGHESLEITYRYAHLFPTIQTEMAENLNQEREEYLDE